MHYKLSILFLLFMASWSLKAQNNSKISYPVTLTVATDGSGDYTSISEALNAFRAYSPVPLKLFIKKGTYKEKVLLPHWLTNLTIEGEDRDQTIISGDDYSGKTMPDYLQSFFHKKAYSTFESYTLAVYGNDICIKNLSIKNTAGRVGQAVALHVEGDKVIIKDCNLSGNQDTLFTGNDSSRQYYDHCYIEGTTDFIFGPATVLFHACEIKSLSNSYITAAATTAAQQFGYVFQDCRLTAHEAAQKVWLGRPWRKYAKTVFIHTEMGNHILPAGWHNWNDTANEKTVFYAEYRNSGNGAPTGNRVKWSRQLDLKSYKHYTEANILRGWTPSTR